ncbi:MAG: response regulator, partial [Syntrophothermus sp.]
MKILIVDDEQDVQHLFMQMFRKERRTGELEMHFAFSAEDALRLLENLNQNGIGLVFSDINMPGMNGLELLR